ncbi:hypothetical protein ACOMHN_064370 [Nucella lapillus]
MRVSAFICTAAVILSILSTVEGQAVKTPQGGSVVGAQCRRAEIPINRPRGSNRLSSDNPVYKLSLTKDGQDHYTVSVQLGSRLLPFSDAFVSAEKVNGSCGVGEFSYGGGDFYRVVQPHLDCPLLLTTNRKSVMQKLPPLHWKAPTCGCVRFRAMVIEASTVYYAEPANTTEGPLAATICFSKFSHRQSEMTIEERTDLLCQVTEQNLGLSIIQRPRFLHNHRLEPRYMDTHAIDLALSLRRHDISACCAKKNEERRECLKVVRRRRVDGFCANGVPDIPFTVLRAAFMRQNEETCCWRLGKARYSCFEASAALKSGRRSVDFSLDHTDPLNDLADYDEELVTLEKKLGTTFFTRPTTPSPFPPTSPTTTPTTTPTPTTTTTTTTTTTPSPPPQPPLPSLLSPGELLPPQFPPSSMQSGHRPHNLRMVVEGEGEGEGRRRGVGEVEDPPSHVSREFGEQGGRSIDKTFAALQRRMWKLSVKTRCCQAGVSAAKAAYGNFNAVWTQCTHSGVKYIAGQSLRHGHKMCSSQFHRCCMEMSISIPPEVVTMAPDSASSREWDRDRHLVHSVYLPPHARPRPPSDTMSRQRHADLSPPRGMTNAERRRALLKPRATRPPLSSAQRAALRQSLLVDEPEIDEEEPQNKRPTRPHRRPHSRERGVSRSRQVDLDDDLGYGRQRRPRKLSSRERKQLGRRSRERLDKLRAPRREMFDDLDIDEEPVFNKNPRRKLSSGGRSKQRRNRHVQPKRTTSPPLVAEQEEEKDVRKENPSPPKTRHPPSGRNSKVHPAANRASSAAETAAERREMRHELEAKQLRKLFAEIAEDVDEDDDEDDDDLVDDDEDDDLVDEDEADPGSEENPDSLGMAEPEGEIVSDEEDEDDDDDDGSEENEDLVDDGETDENVDEPNKSQQEKLPAHPRQDSEDSENVTTKKTSNEKESQSPQTTNPTTTKREPETSPQAEQPLTTTPSPRPRSSQEILPASSRRRSRFHRLRSKAGLSEEDGHSRHSGGRSGRRKRKHHHGRKRYRNLRHFKRRPRVRWNRQELHEALEET